jgi:hypothetical protein
MSVLPRLRHRSCHVSYVSMATFQKSLLPRLRCRSCHVLDVSIATFHTSLLPRSRRWSCHILDVSIATFQTSLLPRSRRRNNNEIYVVEKETSCETTFVRVHCLSFFRQYKVAIASNASLEFDPDVLVRGSPGEGRQLHLQISIDGIHNVQVEATYGNATISSRQRAPCKDVRALAVQDGFREYNFQHHSIL